MNKEEKIREMEGEICPKCGKGIIQVKIEGNSFLREKGGRLSFDSLPNCAYCKKCGMVWA